jgi:hypothetical protein
MVIDIHQLVSALFKFYLFHTIIHNPVVVSSPPIPGSSISIHLASAHAIKRHTSDPQGMTKVMIDRDELLKPIRRIKLHCKRSQTYQHDQGSRFSASALSIWQSD